MNTKLSVRVPVSSGEGSVTVIASILLLLRGFRLFWCFIMWTTTVNSFVVSPHVFLVDVLAAHLALDKRISTTTTKGFCSLFLLFPAVMSLCLVLGQPSDVRESHFADSAFKDGLAGGVDSFVDLKKSGLGQDFGAVPAPKDFVLSVFFVLLKCSNRLTWLWSMVAFFQFVFLQLGLFAIDYFADSTLVVPFAVLMNPFVHLELSGIGDLSRAMSASKLLLANKVLRHLGTEI